MKKTLLAAGIALATISTAAFATVTFDSSTGTGFVGKGDVQVPFGWNNATLQNNAAGVTFTYDTADTYDVTCEWDTVAGNSGRTIHHDITIPRHVQVNSSVDNDPRQVKGQKQFTGFILKGFGAVTSEGTTPVLGGSCPGNNPGLITDVQQTGSSGGLSAHYGSLVALLQ